MGCNAHFTNWSYCFLHFGYFFEHPVCKSSHFPCKYFCTYYSLISIVYLLKSMGYSEETLSGIDKYIHPCIWLFTACYFFAIWHSHALGNIFFFVIILIYWIFIFHLIFHLLFLATSFSTLSFLSAFFN